MNKEDSLWIRFEMFFIFVDLKVILLIVMLFNFYKETVLLADVVSAKRKELVVDVLVTTWQSAGSGYWKWIIIAAIGDIFLKKILRGLHD
jgi:hypothetical protein